MHRKSAPLAIWLAFWLSSPGWAVVLAQQQGGNKAQPLQNRLYAVDQEVGQESFVEEALVSQLPDGLVLVHLRFTQESPCRQHHVLFPKAVSQLVAALPFDELELSLTQGRWHAHRWGQPLLPAKPTGAELTARFSLQLGASSLPGLWGNLSHALGGLFCASLNFVARPEATAVQTISMEQSSPCSPPAPAPAAAGAAAGRTAGRGQMPFDSSSSPHGSVERCKFLPGAAPQHVLYAALPQEASCTENLTPWLKLLPCRDAAGLGQLLMQRGSVFGAEYHSMQVQVRVLRDQQLKPLTSTLTQTLTLALLPPSASSSSSTPPSSNIDLAWLVPQQLQGACPLARHSRLYLHVPGHAVSMRTRLQLQQWSSRCDRQHKNSSNRIEASDIGSDATAEHSTNGTAEGGLGAQRSIEGPGHKEHMQQCRFPVTPAPDAVAVLPASGLQQRQREVGSSVKHLLYVYNLPAASRAAAHGGGSSVLPQTLHWRLWHADTEDPSNPHMQQPPQAVNVVTVTRYITGSGNLHGGMVLQVQLAPASVPPVKAAAGFDDAGSTSSSISLCVFQVVPWMVRLWLHTLQLSINGKVAELASHLTHSHIKTAQDRSRPLELHTCLLLPSSTRSVALSAQFTKAFLTAFEHPPDAHRGFDVPAAQITLGGSAAGMACDSVDPAVEGTMPSGAGGCVWAVVPGGGTAGASAAASLPLMRALAEPQPQQVYSPGLVVPLAVPDFSMPYNVICLTSTVLAVFAGGALNTLLFRPGEAEKQAVSGRGVGKAARKRKQLKLVLVAVVFGGLGVYLDPQLQETLTAYLRQLSELGL